MILRLVISFFMSFCCITAAFAKVDSTEFTPAQQTQIEKIIHQYLVKNPEVLVEATKSLRDLRLQQAQKDAVKVIQARAQELFHDPISPVVGNPQGDVTIVEFIDYQCSHCKGMEPVIKKLRESDRRLRIIYKMLPIFGPQSEFSAKAALASQKQGKFLKFHEALMDAPNPFSEESVMMVAKQVGLNIDQLKEDMKSKDYFYQLRNTYALSTALGIIGTPDFIIATNTEGDPSAIKSYFIPGATSESFLAKAIADIRKK